MKVRQITKWAIVLINILFGMSYAHAQVSIELKMMANDSSITVNFPKFSSKVKAYKDGLSIVLNDKQVVIAENMLYSVVPQSVSAPDIDGWQEIIWNTKVDIDDSLYQARIYAIYGGEIGYADAVNVNVEAPSIYITDDQSSAIRELNWGTTPINKSSIMQVRFFCYGEHNRQNPDVEQAVMIDSAVVSSKDFQLNWLGSDSDPAVINKTPFKMLPGSRYWLNINFTPTTTNYYSDYLTIYFAGGGIKRFPLFANYFPIENKTVLNLIQPNGSEKLRPCETYTVKWKGHSQSRPVSIFFSPDGGTTWNFVASVQDSQYVWTIPDIQTSGAMIKVRQDFNESTQFQLNDNGDDTPIRSVGYDLNGSVLVAANDGGKITEWDLYPSSVQPLVKNRYFINPELQFERVLKPWGSEFTNANDKFAVAYFRKDQGFNIQYDTLAFFETGKEAPVKKIALDRSVHGKKLVVDAARKYLAVVPDMSIKLQLISIEKQEIERTIEFAYPILDFSFNYVQNQSIVSLMNGEVHVLDKDFKTQNIVTVFNEPLIMASTISPDGKLIAVGSVPTMSGQKADINIVDIQTQKVIRTYRPSTGSALKLDFNPVSTSLVTGSVKPDQIMIYDLTKVLTGSKLAGHTNDLTDFKLAPGGRSITSSSAVNDNLIFRNFTYPEEDPSDKTFNIIKPELEIKVQDFGKKYLATTTKETRTVLCNKSEVAVDLSDFRFQSGVHFALGKAWERDTILPGECLSLEIIFNPKDTGKISDQLIFHNCNSDIIVALTGYSIDRNLQFSTKTFDFGDVCIGDTVYKDIQLFKNGDPVDLMVNGISIDSPTSSPFKIKSNISNTVIKPEGAVNVTLSFTPKELGDVTSNVVVYHSDQLKIASKMGVTGKGIGTFVDMSHSTLLYIPEIATRKLKIKNTGTTLLLIQKIYTVPEGHYKINTPTPFNVQPGGESEIEIERTDSFADNVSLIFEATPCLVQRSLVLAPYSGYTNLEIPDVTADPRGEATIQIKFKNVEKGDYKGDRFFDGEITVNPRMFFPLAAESQFGTARITRNQVVDDKRIIGFRVDGNFNNSEAVAVGIRGVVGLAETDSSLLEFVKTAPYWGSAVQNLFKNGKLKLKGDFGDRRILEHSPTLQIKSLSPNPANAKVDIAFDNIGNKDCTIEIIDNLGQKVLETGLIKMSEGANNFSLNVDSINTGTYSIILKAGPIVDSKVLLIVR